MVAECSFNIFSFFLFLVVVHGKEASIDQPQDGEVNEPNKSPQPGPPPPSPGGWGPPGGPLSQTALPPSYYPMFTMVGVEAETNATTYSKKEATIKEESVSSYQSKAGGMGMINVKEPEGGGGGRGGKKRPGGGGGGGDAAGGGADGEAEGGEGGMDEERGPAESEIKGPSDEKRKKLRAESAKEGKGSKGGNEKQEPGKRKSDDDPDAADTLATDDTVENEVWEQPEYELNNKKKLNEVFGGNCKPEDWKSCNKLKATECPAGPKRDWFCMKHGESMYICVIECMHEICGEGNSRIDMKFAGHKKSRIKGAGKCDEIAEKKTGKKFLGT